MVPDALWIRVPEMLDTPPSQDNNAFIMPKIQFRMHNKKVRPNSEVV